MPGVRKKQQWEIPRYQLY
jgi:hypothetical protein